MHIDARQLEDHSIIEGDICIIGAGAAGISIALEWVNTPYKVILLEGGGFEYDDRVQELYRGRTSGQSYYPLKSTRLHYFGGTTGHWGGLCSPFDPLAFEKRDWVSQSGWPFTDKDLLPFYKRAHKTLGLGVYEFGLDYWLKQDPSLVPVPLSGEVFWTKIWRCAVPPARHFGVEYRPKIVSARNVHLYTYANVVDMRADKEISRITEVTVKNYEGKTHKVVAKCFVLACCAIQNSRLLLACNSQSPKGLGNDHDLVGRYFMEHAELKSAELWLKQRSSLKLYRHNPPHVRAELAMTAKTQAHYKVLNAMLSFTPLEMARKTPPFIKSWTHDDPREAGKAAFKTHAKAGRNWIPRFLESDEYASFEVTMRLEQAPNRSSRVALDTEKDALGVPRATLHWEFTDLEKRSARTVYKLLGQQVGIAGIGRVKLLKDFQDERDNSMPDTTSGGWHHMGTTRMSNDPKQGVVDANCKIHGLDNLFIAGSSCFPNGGAVNPTFTLIALSLRLSDHLKEKLNR